MSENIAKILLETKAVLFSPDTPFTYASGLKGPLYCDNRLLLSSVDAREKIIAELAKIIQRDTPQPEIILGLATAGIPHAALLADTLKLPMGYIRSSAKSHGRKKAIEGRIEKNQLALLVEDTINQGKSSAEALAQAREAEIQVSGLVCIVDYQSECSRQLIDVPIRSLTTVSELLEVAVKELYLDIKQAEVVKRWQNNPAEWTP